MKGREFVIDYVHSLYYKCHIYIYIYIYMYIYIYIYRNCGGSYIDSPDWTKNKKTTINLINKRDNKCF